MAIEQAIIFCAGLGTRFKPWTDKHPKALAIINGKSLLQHNVEYLQRYDIRRVIVNVHHFADQIEDAVQNNNGWGSEIIISDEREAVLETGGGLLKAKDLFLPGKDFLTVNVDILCDLNLSNLAAFHQSHDYFISLAVTQRKTSRCFLFEEASNRLTGWKNNQTGEERIAIPAEEPIPKAYSGIALYQYRFLEKVQQRGKFSVVDAFLSLAPDNYITGYDHTGDKWVDVGKPESVAVAEAMFG